MPDNDKNYRAYDGSGIEPREDLSSTLWDLGYAVFHSAEVGGLEYSGPYLVAIDEDDCWVLKILLDYSIPDSSLQVYGDGLPEIRQRVYSNSSTYGSSRTSDCGYAIFYVPDEEWYYVTYSVDEIDDLTAFDKLLEVV